MRVQFKVTCDGSMEMLFLGFPNRMHCSLINTSLIPMTFTLRVPADEIEGVNSFSAITSDYYSQESHESRRREFEITPVTATLTPQSTQEIQVLIKACCHVGATVT